MKAILVLVGVLGAGSAAAAGTLLTSSHAGATAGMQWSGDWDKGRPGPDSARVATLLGAMASTDPVACEMLGDQIGNFWFSGGEWGLGRLSDASSGVLAAKDSVSGRVSDPAAIRLLTQRLSADDPCVRRIAAKMLGNSAVTDDALGRLLDAPSGRVQEAALLAIGEHDRPALRTRVERMLRSEDVALVTMAAWALGELEDHGSVEPLEGVLHHSSAKVRMTAAWALGTIEDPKAVPALLPMLKDGDVSVRWAAADALGDIESVDAAPALEQLVRHEPDRRVRLQAIEALGDIEAARSAPVLAEVLAGNDLELSVAAAEALGGLDNLEHAPPELMRAASSTDPQLRRAAVSALQSIEDPASAPALLPLVNDPDPRVRRDVVEALGQMHAQGAGPALRKALEDSEPSVRKAAVEALAELEDQ